ncbi:MAG: baseplate J/gp47 family protein [Candidatus Limnocylindrales bacterium]
MSAIVYLDIDDEITSAASRLRLLDADRIALVLPVGSRLATSRINFRLLAREAAARNKTLEVVTGDASARALAASAGLTTHLSVAAFERGPGAGTDGRPDTLAPDEAGPRPESPRGRRDPADTISPDDAATVVLRTGPAAVPKGGSPVRQVGPRPSSGPGARTVVFLLILVAVIAAGGAAGFQLLPSATIVLRPSVDTIGPISLNITAQPGITQPDPIGLLVPATTYTFDVAVSDTFPATGLNVVDTAATGEVTFSSLNTGAANPIPEGSIVKTESGIEFRTLGPVTLPTAQIGIVDGRFVVVPSTRKIGVEAVSPGLAGNVPAGAIVVVPERENSKRTIVKNDAPTAGGRHTESQVIQQADVDAALRALDDALAAQFADQLANATDVPAGTTVFPETRSLGPSSTDIDPTTLVGTEVPSFQLGLTARGTVLGVNPEPVSTLAEARIRTSVDRGFLLDEGSISISVGSPIVAGTTITFPVTVRATETRDVDEGALRARIRGLGIPQARTVLRAYGDVTITVWPDWVTTIPTNDARLALTVETATGSSASPSPSGGSTP